MKRTNKQVKSIRLEQYQCIELEELKHHLALSSYKKFTDSEIFRAMLNFAIKNKEVIKAVIERKGFVKIEDLNSRTL